MTEAQNESPLIDPNIVSDAPVATPVITAKPAKPDMGGFIWGTGRRKSSVARVRVKPGKGELKINKREIHE
ncbi:MAG: 30S ribosomal protein S9, partial [Planctomycetota bacterium]